ncbi:MAG TPA: S8 family serine peptidase, partial [Candidatus Sulfomarinibacteraceae bacterium]|nr:S8 family serine peptidase [Candidatus Sulfomarinibacteraceae bacterium]
MIRVPHSKLVALAAAIALCAVATAGWAATTAVRIPAAQVASYESLGIVALDDLDYGSFRWLILDETQLDRLAAAGVAHTVVEDAGTVQVMGFRFDPLAEGEPDLPPGLRADPDRPGLRLLQVVAPVRDEWISELGELGITPLQYYPHNTFLVWSGPAEMDRAAELPFVRWHGLFHPAYKANTNLDGLVGVIQNVDVMFVNDGRVEQTLEDIEKQGGVVLQHYPSQPDRRFFNAIVELDAEAVDAAAMIPTVLWLGYQSPEPILDDEMSDQIIADNHPGGVPQTGYLSYLAGLGYDGSGVIWAPIDTGVDYDHPDLFPSIVGGYSFPNACVNYPPGSDCAGGGHGTHVSGIIGGTGVGDTGGPYTDPSGFRYGLGVAPGYSIFAMNSLSASAWPPAGGWQEHSKRAVLGNAIGGNNSWTTGEGTQHGYQASERTHDIMVRDGNFDTAAVAEPFIEVFSAGNSGSSGLTAPKEGKNLIVTAASVNYRAGNIDTIASFSSRGPAVDGRWVPTIAAPGEQIASTRNDEGGSCGTAISGTNGLYSFCSGTSMAAPHTSGAIVLATEWWRTFNAGADPSPAMAKALLVNSADDMATPDIPNIHEGWGRINVDTMINPSVTRVYRDQDYVFGATGEQLIIPLGVPDPSQPLKITLAWSDAPGAVGANPALVNNLDLTVEVGGSTYLGNVFSGGWSTTGGSADAINNLENVFVASPGGSAIITIDATAIVGDGVPYNGDTTDQDFALVCSNCALEPDFYLTSTPSSRSICAPADALYSIEVGSILSYSDPVTLSASGNPAGSTVGFSTNPVTPPGTSTMTIGNTGAAAAGLYPILVTGVAPTKTHELTVELGLFTGAPGAPSLVAPADGAVNVPARPTFEWSSATQGESHRLQVATDAAFTNLVIDQSGITETQFTPASDLATSSVYYWRVASGNPCGTGAFSSAFSFSTEALPGDCGIGTVPSVEFFDDLEGGAPGWALGSGGSGNTWALSTTRSYSSATSYYAVGSSTTSDQRLDSPAVALPTGANPLTLQFWNWQLMEDRSG